MKTGYLNSVIRVIIGVQKPSIVARLVRRVSAVCQRIAQRRAVPLTMTAQEPKFVQKAVALNRQPAVRMKIALAIVTAQMPCVSKRASRMLIVRERGHVLTVDASSMTHASPMLIVAIIEFARQCFASTVAMAMVTVRPPKSVMRLLGDVYQPLNVVAMMSVCQKRFARLMRCVAEGAG